MARARFPKGKQRKFLKNVKVSLGETWDEVARVCKLHPRTVRDWAREKYNMSHDAVMRLSKVTKITVPNNVKILPKYWSTKKAGRIGARRRFELYGPLGTPESRRKGGLATQKKIRSDPEFAKRVGIVTRKKIHYPKHSDELAGFIGILLGDGSVRNEHQITISFDSKIDKRFSKYCQELIKKLFHIKTIVCISYFQLIELLYVLVKHFVHYSFISKTF